MRLSPSSYVVLLPRRKEARWKHELLFAESLERSEKKNRHLLWLFMKCFSLDLGIFAE